MEVWVYSIFKNLKMLEINSKKIIKLLESILEEYSIDRSILEKYNKKFNIVIDVTKPTSIINNIKNKYIYTVYITGMFELDFIFTNLHDIKIHNFVTEIKTNLGSIESNSFKTINNINESDSNIIEQLLNQIPIKKEELNNLKIYNLFKKL